jgi:hypothetical protein
MDAAAIALVSLVKVVSAQAVADGVDVTLMYDGDPAAPPPPLTIDGRPAEVRGSTRQAHAAWTIAWDAEIATQARFRDARQLALYFTTGLPPGDRANVVVIKGGGDWKISGWGTIDDLVRLRAPIDATLDPAKMTATDADPMYVPDAGPPPGDEPLRHVRVDARASVVDTDVHVFVAAEGPARVAQLSTVQVGRAQKDGPRLAANVRADVARTAIATWRAARVGPDAEGHELSIGADAGARRHVPPFGIPDPPAAPLDASHAAAADTMARSSSPFVGAGVVVAAALGLTAAAIGLRRRRTK